MLSAAIFHSAINFVIIVNLRLIIRWRERDCDRLKIFYMQKRFSCNVLVYVRHWNFASESPSRAQEEKRCLEISYIALTNFYT